MVKGLVQVVAWCVGMLTLSLSASEKILETASGPRASDAKLQAEYARLFAYKSITAPGFSTTVNYRLYVPADYDSTKKYPVILYLHAYGERDDGSNTNEAQLSWGMLHPFFNQGYHTDHPCIIVAPQCPKDKTWHGGKWETYTISDKEGDGTFNETIRLCKRAVDETIATYSVDTNRLYVVGASMGGFGVWNIVTHYPDTFAAAVPNCSAGDPTKASRLTDLPIWAFHGDSDPTINVAGTRNMYDAIVAAGGKKITYTEFVGMDHYCWRYSYVKGDLWNWVFAQTRAVEEPPADETVEQGSWFDAGVLGYATWPADGSDKTVTGVGTWTGTAQAELVREADSARLSLVGMETEQPLVFDTLADKAVATERPVVSAVLRFTAAEEPGSLDPEAKGAITVVGRGAEGAYYVLAAQGTDTTNGWVRATGPAPVLDEDVAVSMSFREVGGAMEVSYSVNGAPLLLNGRSWCRTAPANSSPEVTSVSYRGIGEVAALTGTSRRVEPVALSVPALDGCTLVAVKVGGVPVEVETDGTYLVPPGDDITVSYKPATGFFLSATELVFTMGEEPMEIPAEAIPEVLDPKGLVFINELMASNGETLATAHGMYGLDWIELRNDSDADVDLTGWYLFDDPTKKKSKWEKIQGSCVIPAHGFKVVWADKDYADFEPGEAWTSIGLSNSGEPLFLADPNGRTVDEIENFGLQIKDTAYGRGHVTRSVIPVDARAEYRIGTSDVWKSAQGPIGMSHAEAAGFEVVTYKINKAVGSMATAKSCLQNPSTWTSVVTNTVETINFKDKDNPNQFVYTDFPGVSDADNFILVVTGTVQIPHAGLWTFACGSDDGFTASVARLGETWTWEHPGSRGHSQSYSTFNLPEAGAYDVSLIYYDHTGGASLDLSVAEGDVDFNTNDFHLLGSAESGVLHAGSLGAHIAVDVTAEMKNVAKTLDWRATFTRASEPTDEDEYRLRIRYADGFTARLNGEEFARKAATASNRNPKLALEPESFTVPTELVKAGENVLEITGINNAQNSGEFFLSAELLYDRGSEEWVYLPLPTPGAANDVNGKEAPTDEVAFSVPHGYKTEPFTVALSCPSNTSAAIYYTLDGTSPTLASTRYTEPIAVSKTTVIRAAVPNGDSVLQRDASASYLFVDDILTQPATAPAGFPANKAVNNQAMRYGMNQTIVGKYRENVLNGFTNSIETLSLVIDPECLFGATKGIYVNATGDGRAWERPLMVESISPTNETHTFSVPAGLRIRGAYSRGADKAKHSFRLFFRSAYGMGSLKFPLFGEEGANSYQKVDLRTSQNFSWSNAGSVKETFIHETWPRDSQRDMGQPYNRSRYYHLFINGTYWGLYETEERCDEDYAETYYGGKAENYDVIRTSQPGYVTGVSSGEDAAWTAFWDMTVNEGYAGAFADNYLKAQGLNPDGTRNPDYPVYLVPENIMAYVLTAHYGADTDSPASASIANNINAFRHRYDGTNETKGITWRGFAFNRHDAEHSLGMGDKSDTTLFGTEAHPANGANFKKKGNFNPSEIHYKLCENPEYRQAFADFVYRTCVKTGGAMTAPLARARFEARMAEITDAVACESARWGSEKLTRDTWLAACNNCLAFIDGRVPELLAQYRARGWYPSVEAPVVTPGPATVALAGEGTVYYTTDGSDPRAVGGDPAATACTYTKPLLIPTEDLTLKVRVLSSDGEWSALDEMVIAGVDPKDYAAVFEDLSFASDRLMLRATATPGLVYTLLKATDVTGPYEPVAHRQAGADETSLSFEIEKGAEPSAFFKIEVGNE